MPHHEFEVPRQNTNRDIVLTIEVLILKPRMEVAKAYNSPS